MSKEYIPADIVIANYKRTRDKILANEEYELLYALYFSLEKDIKQSIKDYKQEAEDYEKILRVVQEDFGDLRKKMDDEHIKLDGKELVMGLLNYNLLGKVIEDGFN